MERSEMPGWLETLWNVNQRIAQEAETELERLYNVEKSAKELLSLIEQREKLLNTF